MHRTSVHARAIAVSCAWVLTILSFPRGAQADEACTPAIAKAGWQTITVHSGGVDRKVSLYVPASGVGRAHLPLVFDLHGSGGNGRSQALNSGFSRQADLHGFLVANPDGGIADPKNPQQSFFWNIPGVPLTGDLPTPTDAPDEVQFFRDAIGQIGTAACTDPRRVYVTGFSGGARMTSLLACELSDRIEAIAPVSGLRAGVPDASDHSKPDIRTCAPMRPVSIITFHGVNDPQNRFAGDGTPRWGYAVSVALDRWAQLDGCRPTPSEERVSTHVTKVRYLGCRAESELILYRTEAPVDHGGGHIWPHPGGAASSGSVSQAQVVDELDATALIWEFFIRHHL